MSLDITRFSILEWVRALVTNPYFWAGLGVLGVMGIGAFYVVDTVIMPSYTRHGASVRVPDVESRSFETAKSIMQEKGLDVRRQVGRYNPNVPQDVVVDQTPLPRSSVKPGRRVYLTVNTGEVPMVAVPDLNGVSVREAKNRISSAGLEVGSVQPDSIPSPYANTITRQSPVPGDSLREGSRVDLWYSTGLGEKVVVVPNVVGRSLTDARQVLLNNKLRFVIVDTTGMNSGQNESGAPSATGDVSADTTYFVRQQGQSPGTTVRAGTQVRLFATADPTAIASPSEVAENTTRSDTAGVEIDPE